MKCKVKNLDFSRELRLLEKVVGKKPTIAVLSNVLVEVHEKALVMSATDLEVGLVGACVAEVEEPGAFTLPVKKLSDLVKVQSGDEITLTLEPKGVTFRSGKFRSTLQTLPPEDFPPMPEMEGDIIELPRDDLKLMLQQVRYAVCESDSRYLLNCVYMGLEESTFRLAAIDGPRLSVSVSPRPGEEAVDPVLIPGKALDELMALLSEQDEGGTVKFCRNERHLFFEVDGRLMVSRQIDGKFPNYEKFLEGSADGHVATVDRDMVASVLKRLVLIDDVVKLHVQDGILGLSSVGSGVGDGDEELFMSYEGPELERCYNGNLFLDFLGQAPSQEVEFVFHDSEKRPTLLRDKDFRNIVMGIKK